MENPRDSQLTSNMISFDIESFLESLYDTIEAPSRPQPKELEAKEIEGNTVSILELLEGLNQKATFFVLGRLGRDMPCLVRSIVEAGHEVACHGLYHRRLYHSSVSQVRESLRVAKEYLQNACGVAICGFRAPEFSITKRNLWVFELLREAGFEYDSSVYPTMFHHAYGIAGFPRAPFRFPNGLIVVPLSVISIFGGVLPFGGGGYLQLYPLSFTRLFFRVTNLKSLPGVIYSHPYEVGDTLPHVPGLPISLRLRAYAFRKSLKRKLVTLIQGFHFMPIKDYLDRFFLSEGH